MMQLLSDEFLPLLGSETRLRRWLGVIIRKRLGMCFMFWIPRVLNRGSLGIPREDRGNLGNITEDLGESPPSPLRILSFGNKGGGVTYFLF